MRRRDAIARSLVGATLMATGTVATWKAHSETAANVKVISVVARKFVFLPNEIELQLGESVLLELTAPEVAMGFYAPELKLRAVIVPGTPSRVAFTPQRSGRFDFVCDVFCGDGHEGMSGQITVVG